MSGYNNTTYVPHINSYYLFSLPSLFSANNMNPHCTDWNLKFSKGHEKEIRFFSPNIKYFQHQFENIYISRILN